MSLLRPIFVLEGDPVLGPAEPRIKAGTRAPLPEFFCPIVLGRPSCDLRAPAGNSKQTSKTRPSLSTKSLGTTSRILSALISLALLLSSASLSQRLR